MGYIVSTGYQQGRLAALLVVSLVPYVYVSWWCMEAKTEVHSKSVASGDNASSIISAAIQNIASVKLLRIEKRGIDGRSCFFSSGCAPVHGSATATNSQVARLSGFRTRCWLMWMCSSCLQRRRCT